MKTINATPNNAPLLGGFEYWLVSAEAEYAARLNGAAIDFAKPNNAAPSGVVAPRLVDADVNPAEGERP